MDENTNAHIDKLTNEIVDFVRYSFLYPDEMLKIIQSSYEALDNIQPVVKCKDCKYRFQSECTRTWFQVNDDDFCSYGEIQKDDK